MSRSSGGKSKKEVVAMSSAISSSGGNDASSTELDVCWLELKSASGMLEAVSVDDISPGDGDWRRCAFVVFWLEENDE